MGKINRQRAGEIRDKYKNTTANTSTLAREYGVSKQFISEILHNNVWRDPDYVYEKASVEKRYAKAIARVRADKGDDECWDNDSVYTRMYGYKIYRRITGDKRSGAYMHTCGNDDCWNPKHITIDDRLARNSSMFTVQQIQEMTDLWLTGEYTFIELGKRYETHYNVVAGIIRRYLTRKGLDIVLPTREKQHARDREVMARLAQGEKLTDIARAMGIKYQNAVRIKNKYTKGQDGQ